jgi:hypothetical protein
MNMLLLVSRWFHIAAAIVAVGGAFFTFIALMPAAKATLTDDVHDRLREAIRARWSKVVHACVAILLVTGAINFAILAIPPKVEPMPYHAIFGVKFFAALAIFFIAEALVGSAPGFAKIRAQRAKYLALLLSLAAIVVLLSGVLNQVRSSQTPKPTSGPMIIRG